MGLFALARAITYATFFIGFSLVYLPSRVLAWAGVARPTSLGVAQIAGLLIGGLGTLLAISCIVSFAFMGRGTPFPIDPPRRLVVRGPYRVVRNPMYVGAILALAGASLFYQSWALFGYCATFALIVHLFVLAYEEPTLRHSFGSGYAAYCAEVGRWWPRFSRRSAPPPEAAA